jgi:hypothetical protein
MVYPFWYGCIGYRPLPAAKNLWILHCHRKKCNPNELPQNMAIFLENFLDICNSHVSNTAQ